ncbi:hypothetical protein CL673_00905 [Candidatus Bathyarchaeota archaeon]|jgi:transcription elongation factor Elf1|nr:hypothetical protein [Candidatus Bathyarchaeota archaeon]MDP6048700.1 hypothetical protein [Candidatus Bathyarchaeota archaeon]MDP7443435.1 hypothetical protein [Candidatus Bathyarchaeota archaeon]
MGRRKKQVTKYIRRALPELFLCPRCGKNTVKASINKAESKATVICSNCSLRTSFAATRNLMSVDAYCTFIDQYYTHGSQEEEEIA